MHIVFIFTYPESMLTFSIQPYKCQVPAAQCRTAFPCWNTEDVHLMGHVCPVHLLVFKNQHFCLIHVVVHLVEALRYKSEGCGFDSR